MSERRDGAAEEPRIRVIPVLYDERQNARILGSLSPSAAKPARVVESWRSAGMPIALTGFDPVQREAFESVHDPDYVDALLALRRPNGFGTLSAEVNASLFWTSGSMLAAARRALLCGAACSPTSGFHHAGYRSAHGFCTLNGLAVAAKTLLDEGAVQRVGVLDCDRHNGDGTASIIHTLGLADRIEHYSFGLADAAQARSRDGRAGDLWLDRLPGIVRRFAARGCGVVLYQAGADPHVDDPLGGILSSEQMRRRDAIVFGALKALGIPVAWNLAGGYQTPLRRVLDLHDATMAACVATHIG